MKLSKLKKPKRLRPGFAAAYWYIDTYCSICCTKWYDSVNDIERYTLGNCYKTHEQAESVAQKIRHIHTEAFEQEA